MQKVKIDAKLVSVHLLQRYVFNIITQLLNLFHHTYLKNSIRNDIVKKLLVMVHLIHGRHDIEISSYKERMKKIM